jgi:protease-4
VDQDGLRQLIGQSLGEVDPTELAVLSRYGQAQREPIDLSSPFGLFALLGRRAQPTTRPVVSLIYAEGMIVDGDAGDELFGAAVGSDTIRRALRMAHRDDQVKAIVLRIDSPGGSAVASEAIWQACRRVAMDKPVVVSIGQMAASGGYYLATAGDHIVADPSAIVGSIGVVGGKIVYKDLMDRIGVRDESFRRGRNADLFDANQPFSEAQRRIITAMMKETYELFTSRVMATRGGRIKDIDRVARGRVFLAGQAQEMGLVDELGGLDDALAYAGGKAGLDAGEFDVRVLPAPKTLADLLSGDDDGAPRAMLAHARGSITADSMLLALPARLRAALLQQLQFVQLMQESPVQLVAPYTLILR